jgi:peroxiredoxin
MTNRLMTLLLAGGLLAGMSGGLLALPADTNSSPQAKTVADFRLPDLQGKTVSLSGFSNGKAVVVLFLGTECPINNAYLPRLAELYREYSPKGVQFVGINSNRQDTIERMKAHAARYEIPFPVLRDENAVVADQLHARRVPEVVVLDGQRKVRYQGRISDQFGVGYKRAQATREDLAVALDELLAGKPVSQPTTAVAGCLIAREVKAKSGSEVTFTTHVASILQKHCQECHRPGQVGPMPLVSYDDASNWSEMVREVLTDGRMPPWHADPRFGEFSNDRRLPAEARKTLLDWIDAGCPKGNDKDMPPARQWVEGWSIGKPDMLFTMQEDFDVPAKRPKNGIEYQYISVKTNFTEDKWIERAEAKPGAPEVVHHIILFIVPPGLKFIPQLGNAPVLCGTAPGDMPMVMPPGMAKKIPAGSELVFQMHYTPNGRAQKDRSSVGIVFAKQPPDRQVHTMPIATPPPSLRIPAGADNHQVESSWTFPGDGQILSFMPHMHLRGKDFLVESIAPDSKKETLLSIPRFDFNWQSVYRYTRPIPVAKGTKIHCVAHFDNSAKNLSNPDPSQEVRWGDQTWEEMMIGWMDFVLDPRTK